MAKGTEGQLIDKMIKMSVHNRRMLFIVAYGLYVFGSAFESTTFNGIGLIDKNLICNLAQIAALLLFIVKIFTQTYEPRHIAWIAVGGALSAVSVTVTRDYTVAWATLFIIAAQDVTLEDAAKVVSYTTLLVCLLALVGWATGFNSNVIAARDNGLLRYALGFGHTNRLAACIAITCVSWIASHARNLRKRDLLILAATAALVYVLTNSRTTVASLMVFFAVVAYEIYANRGVSPAACLVLMIVAAVGSLFLMFGYELLPMDWQGAFNSILTYRPYYFASYLHELGITLFGSNLAATNIQYVPGVEAGIVIDNSYVALLLGKGVVVFALLLGLYAMCFRGARDNGVYASFCLAMVYFLVCGFAENTLASIATNFCTMGIAYLLYGSPAEPVCGLRAKEGRYE